MSSNAINIRISTNDSGGGLRCESIMPEVAGCQHVLGLAGTPDLGCADETGSLHGSSCCPYADAHISNLKGQLKEVRGKVEWLHNERIKAQQRLQDWTGKTTLHPAFIGEWERIDQQLEMVGTSRTVRVSNLVAGWTGDVYSIERLAPYVFAAERDCEGHALYTLLPSLDQLVRVTYGSHGTSKRHLWVKK